MVICTCFLRFSRAGTLKVASHRRTPLVPFSVAPRFSLPRGRRRAAGPPGCRGPAETLARVARARGCRFRVPVGLITASDSGPGRRRKSPWVCRHVPGKCSECWIGKAPIGVAISTCGSFQCLEATHPASGLKTDSGGRRHSPSRSDRPHPVFSRHLAAQDEGRSLPRAVDPTAPFLASNDCPRRTSIWPPRALEAHRGLGRRSAYECRSRWCAAVRLASCSPEGCDHLCGIGGELGEARSCQQGVARSARVLACAVSRSGRSLPPEGRPCNRA
jgi:hypothetical protein